MSKYIEVEELENLVQHENDECKEELATANYESTRGLFYIMSAANRVVTIAKNMPSIEIVRCKDCHFYDRNNNGGLKKHGLCEIYKGFKTDDGFCDLAEWREDE